MEKEINQIIHTMEENFNEYYRLLNRVQTHMFNADQDYSFLEKELYYQLLVENEILEFRLKKIQEMENPYLPAIDINKIESMYKIQNSNQLEILCERFLALRKNLLQFLYATPGSNWERTGLHERDGHITFKELVQRMIRKDREILHRLQEKFNTQKSNTH